MHKIRTRHQRGRYAIACDHEANEHYGITNEGLPATAWRLLCYLKGFAGR